MIRLVYGPPGAGKSTYARENSSPGDLVIDLDQIRSTVDSEATARKLRSLMESGARDHADGDVWIVRTLADATERAEFRERVGVEESILLDADADLAKTRTTERDGNDDKHRAIDEWWTRYTPDSPDEGRDEDDMTVTTAKPNQDATTADAAAPGALTEAEAHASHSTEDQQGFPAETPVSEMTAEQQAAYWKHFSRRHERNADALAAQVEKDKADAEAWRQQQAQQATQTPEEKQPDPAEQARSEALREVFDARFDAAVAKLPEHDFEPLKKHLDMSSFVDSDGRIDRDAITGFIESLPSGAPENPETPEGWGSNKPYAGANGVDIGRELFAARHGRN